MLSPARIHEPQSRDRLLEPPRKMVASEISSKNKTRTIFSTGIWLRRAGGQSSPDTACPAGIELRGRELARHVWWCVWVPSPA